MRFILHRRSPYAAGYAIHSDRWHLLPWVAVSLAAHGMLLYIFYISFKDIPVPAPAGQVMVVALQDGVSAHARSQPAGDSAPQVQQAETTAVDEHRQMAVTSPAVRVQSRREVAAAAQHQPIAPEPADRRNTRAQGMNAQAAKQTVPAAQAMADRERRLLRIRRHLEHFKYYPASARRRGIEGQVEVSFDLDTRGMASRLQLLSRSGYRILDRAALETVRRASPFPARGGHYRFQLVFRQS